MTAFLWERFGADGQPDARSPLQGGVLQRLRRGAHLEPGSAPELWPYYTQLTSDGRLTRELRAEHACLVTFGHHQQSVSHRVHHKGVNLGEALRAIHRSQRFSPEAVDARVARLATAQNISETVHHLGSLVQLMKATKQPISFDYTELFRDLVALQNELSAGKVRRRWGAAYYSQRNDEA